MHFRVLILLFLLSACSTFSDDGVQDVHVAYPANTESVSVSLQIGSGTLNLTPSGGNALTGSIDTNVARWQPQIETSGDQISIRQGQISDQVIVNSFNNWNLQLGGAKPLALLLNHRDANVDLNLSGLPVQTLVSQGRNGRLSIMYPTANTLNGITAQIALTQGDLMIDNLLNSGISFLNTQTTSGSQTFILSGQPLADTINISARTSTGEVVVRVPNNVPVQVTFRTTSGVVQQMDDIRFVSTGNRVYETKDFNTATGARILIEVVTVAGDLRLLGI